MTSHGSSGTGRAPTDPGDIRNRGRDCSHDAYLRPRRREPRLVPIEVPAPIYAGVTTEVESTIVDKRESKYRTRAFSLLTHARTTTGASSCCPTGPTFSCTSVLRKRPMSAPDIELYEAGVVGSGPAG
jgi:hypothetical protein